MSSDMLYKVKVLEMEKNEIRVELGLRKMLIIREEFNDPVV